MTKQQIEQAAETHADKYSDDPHAIAKESFIAGALWAIENKELIFRKRCACGNTEPCVGMCLNCGSSLNY